MWEEFDLDNSNWVIPAPRMKMKKPHAVPLSRQAIDILNELQQISGDGAILFPGIRSKERPISDNSLNAALRRLGYAKEQMTTHGFRTTASTNLHEQGYESALIELQLAHADTNKIRSAYNRAKRLPERRKMMQDWADWLDDQKRKIAH
jgi:integrase